MSGNVSKRDHKEMGGSDSSSNDAKTSLGSYRMQFFGCKYNASLSICMYCNASLSMHCQYNAS